MITILIILITTGISYYAWQKPSFESHWMLVPFRVWHNKEYLRLLQCGFIHLDWNHLIFNMFTLYFFANGVERAFDAYIGFGASWMVSVYLLGILFSALPTVYKHRNNKHYQSLGASGGVAALVFASIVIRPNAEIGLWGILYLPGIYWALIYLFYTIYQSRKMGNDGINHDAHLAGALFGALFTFLMIPGSFLRFWEQLGQIFSF